MNKRAEIPLVWDHLFLKSLIQFEKHLLDNLFVHGTKLSVM
jgi:hypothetical protein